MRVQRLSSCPTCAAATSLCAGRRLAQVAAVTAASATAASVHGGACAECHQEATIIDPTAQKQRSPPQNQPDEPPEQEATIVGMRMEAGVCERFMFWAGYSKDECTWEVSENTLDDEHLEVRTVLELLSTSGSRLATIILVPPTGAEYTMQLSGRTTRADPDAGTQVKMDLAGWDFSRYNGWTIQGYTEWVDPDEELEDIEDTEEQ